MASARLSAPTQARGVEKRERIYQAAIDQFRRNGVKGTRVEDVIADAGVSWATFFRYFPRKEDVLLEAAARHFREHVKVTAEAGIADRRRRVRTVMERTFTEMLGPTDIPSELNAAALLEVFADPPRFAELVGEGPFPMVQLVATLIAEGQRRGEVDPDLDPGAAAMTVVAGAVFPAVQAAASGLDPVAGVEHALTVLWRGLARDVS
jgi:AcrR family transcriptional regulator